MPALRLVRAVPVSVSVSSITNCTVCDDIGIEYLRAEDIWPVSEDRRLFPVTKSKLP